MAKNMQKNTQKEIAKPLKKISTAEQKKLIREKAAAAGLGDNYYFISTLDRYETQISILKGLKKEIKKHGATVTKEYVKGRENLTVNPAITEYNRTATAANGTLTTLLNIIKTMAEDQENGGRLQEFIKQFGGND